MRKTKSPESAFSSARLTAAVLLCLSGVSLALFASAAPFRSAAGKNAPASEAPSPSSGTLSLAMPTLNYTGGGPFVVANTTAQAGPPLCTGPMFCDDYALTINVPPGTSATKFIKVTVSWPVAAADFDVYVYNGATEVASAASSSDPKFSF